jgi:transcription elongation GreA/GreB family factor
MNKDLVIKCLKESIDSKVVFLQQSLEDLKHDLSMDTKSSAGDKHETSRAMVHLEQEKLSKQLRDFLNMKDVVNKLLNNTSGQRINSGSLIKANNDWFLISVPFGTLTIDNQKVFILSPQSPIGQLLLNKKVGDEIVFNGNHRVILSIF